MLFHVYFEPKHVGMLGADISFAVFINDFKFLIDINECATDNGGCEVHCTNTIGSFNCSCDFYETLDSTGLFCIGM